VVNTAWRYDRDQVIQRMTPAQYVEMLKGKSWKEIMAEMSDDEPLKAWV
jgi:hypothetical protein